MKGFIELESLMSGTPEATGFPMMLSVADIVAVMDMDAIPEEYAGVKPCVGTRTVFMVKSREEPLCSSMPYSTARDLIKACVGA